MLYVKRILSFCSDVSSGPLIRITIRAAQSVVRFSLVLFRPLCLKVMQLGLQPPSCPLNHLCNDLYISDSLLSKARYLLRYTSEAYLYWCNTHSVLCL